MNKTKAFQKALQEDIESVRHLSIETLSARNFYLPLLKVWFRYFMLVSLASLTVILGLAFFTWTFFLHDVEHLALDIICIGAVFSVAIIMFTLQYHLFRIMGKGRFKSLEYIGKVIWRFELVFLGIYIFFFTFCLHAEGTIGGTTMGSALSGFVASLLLTALVIMLESQRVGLPVILSLLQKFNERYEKTRLDDGEDA